MRVVAIVQASATGSTRMGHPKVLAKVDRDRTMLECVLDRVSMCQLVGETWVAAPDLADERSMALRALCKSRDWRVYYGSEADVLHRYRVAAELSNATHVLRVTADCPFLAPEVADMVIAEHVKAGAHYTANNLEDPRWPHGFDCEAISTQALQMADAEELSDYVREHVTECFRRGWQDREEWAAAREGLSLGSRSWRVKSLTCPWRTPQPKLRLTVDTPDDLDLTRALYAKIPAYFTTEQLMSACRENQNLLAMNGSVWNAS